MNSGVVLAVDEPSASVDECPSPVEGESTRRQDASLNDVGRRQAFDRMKTETCNGDGRSV